MRDPVRMTRLAADALLVGDPEKALSYMEKIGGIAADHPQAEALRQELCRVASLASSAGDGLADARQTLVQIRDLTGRLDHYDLQGRWNVPTALECRTGRF